MSAPKCVLGVSGVCRVCFANPTQLQTRNGAGLPGAVLGVLGLRARTRACALLSDSLNTQPLRLKDCYARTEKPNTPDTLNTASSNLLICKAFECVGCVLGRGVFVLGRFSGVSA